MTSHFTGGGPQSSWGPPLYFLITTDTEIGEFIQWIHPSNIQTIIETLDPILFFQKDGNHAFVGRCDEHSTTCSSLPSQPRHEIPLSTRMDTRSISSRTWECGLQPA